MAESKPEKLTNPIEVHFNVISKYHYFVYGLLFLSNIPIFWHMLSSIFVTPRLDFFCEDIDGDNSTKNACPCKNPGWARDVFSRTLHAKFGTQCERSWLIGMSQSMLYLGTLLGSLVFGFLADKFGRLSMFCLSVFVTAVFGCVVIVMPTIASYIIFRILEGAGAGGAIVTGYVFCIEYCGLKHREIVTSLYHVPFNVSHMTLAGVSYLLRDCDNLQLAISVPLFFFVTLRWCIQESPKWLMDSNQIEKAAWVMEKVSKFNRTPPGNIRAEMEAYHAATLPTRTGANNIQFWHIFKHRHLVINFTCMSFIYFVCAMGYFGVSQYIGQMSGNIHENVAVSGATLIPGTLSTAFLFYLLSRRTFLMATSFISGILMIIVILVPPDMVWARVIIACICNCAFFMSFIIVFLYGVELFPTAVRNSVMGVLAMMARIGQIAAPVINHLPETASGAIFGALAILGGILCLPLPETKYAELPSSLEDSGTLRRRTTYARDGEDPSINIDN